VKRMAGHCSSNYVSFEMFSGGRVGICYDHILYNCGLPAS
jgi:hypothetical protein